MSMSCLALEDNHDGGDVTAKSCMAGAAGRRTVQYESGRVRRVWYGVMWCGPGRDDLSRVLSSSDSCGCGREAHRGVRCGWCGVEVWTGTFRPGQ